MPQDRSEFRFWRAVGVRLLGILLIGWLAIIWFQGCLVPLTKNEMQREQEMKGEGGGPPR